MATKAALKPFPVEQEYGKKTGITPQDISKLREWLHTQPHLPAEHITDQDLILTYHCCDQSAEVSKQLLDLHFTLRTLFTSFFKDRSVDDRVERSLKSVLLKPLPTRTKEGYAVLYASFMEHDSKNFNVLDVMRTVIMVLDIWQYEEGTWPGFVIVFNLEGMSMGHIAKFELHSIQQYLYYLQEGILANLKAVHYLNAPSFMDRFLMIIRPFMKNTLLDFLYVHQVGSKTIENYYPIEALPKEDGGNYLSAQECKEAILAKLKASKDYFVEESKKRVVESRRPGKPKTISDIFGSVEGSFKKLEVD